MTYTSQMADSDMLCTGQMADLWAPESSRRAVAAAGVCEKSQAPARVAAPAQDGPSLSRVGPPLIDCTCHAPHLSRGKRLHFFTSHSGWIC